MQPASLALISLLIALASAQPGPRVAQESSLPPAKFLQLFTTAEKLANDDVGDKIEEVDEEQKLDDDEGKQLMLIGAAKRSYGVNIPGNAIMRALKRSQGMPRSIRLGVQQHAMLRYLLHLIYAMEHRENYTLMLRSLRSSSPSLGISQDSLMRSLRSAAESPENAGVDLKRSYKINLPENAMMRSLRSDEGTGISDAAMLRSLRSYKPGVADEALMRSLRSSNPNIVDAAMMRSLRSQDLNVARDALLRSLRQDNSAINQQAMMRSLRSFQPNNVNDAAMMRALRSYKPNIADNAMMRSLRSYAKNIKDEALMRSLRSSLPTRLVTRDPLKEGIMRGL